MTEDRGNTDANSQEPDENPSHQVGMMDLARRRARRRDNAVEIARAANIKHSGQC